MDIKPTVDDVKSGTVFGENSSETGTYLGETTVEVNTGRIIQPISETQSLVV